MSTQTQAAAPDAGEPTVIVPDDNATALVAIVAAIALTTRARRGLKHQDINLQVSVKSTDRVRLVKAMGTKAP